MLAELFLGERVFIYEMVPNGKNTPTLSLYDRNVVVMALSSLSSYYDTVLTEHIML